LVLLAQVAAMVRQVLPVPQARTASLDSKARMAPLDQLAEQDGLERQDKLVIVDQLGCRAPWDQEARLGSVVLVVREAHQVNQ
jgi:hypothetical protein